jgi:hypothetical protein
MQIDRLHSTLYAVSLADSSSGTVLLQTSLFRAEPGP